MHSLKSAGIGVVIIWLYVILFVGVGVGLNNSKGYEVPTPYWCWIGKKFPLQRLFGEYLWFWLNLLFSIITYFLLFFYYRGNITMNERTWWRFGIHRSNGQRRNRDGAFIFLAYPSIYLVLILPQTFSRWIQYGQERHGGVAHIPSAFTYFCVTVFGLSGVANVALFLLTRPNLSLFRMRPMAKSDIEREESQPASGVKVEVQPIQGTTLPPGPTDLSGNSPSGQPVNQESGPSTSTTKSRPSTGVKSRPSTGVKSRPSTQHGSIRLPDPGRGWDLQAGDQPEY
jgi:hypothetical protein